MRVILGFRTSTYARNIYAYGTSRLTTRDGFTGVAEGYYSPTQQYAITNFGKSVVDNALAKKYIKQQEYDETLAVIQLTTPLAPSVTADDGNNVITGLNFGMEYALDGATEYTIYKGTVLDLTGEHTVNVRVTAVPFISNASLPTILTFTANNETS